MVRVNRIFLLLCLASAITLAVYIYWSRTRNSTAAESAALPVESPGLPSPSPTMSAAPLPTAGVKPEAPPDKPADSGVTAGKSSKQVFFRYNGLDGNFGRLAFVPAGQTDQPHFIDKLSCEVAYIAGGRGICLSANRAVLTTYAAKLFDAKTFQILAELSLKGIPSRCRVSRDGKLAALTVFISGHGYASVNFSTQTLLLEANNGRVVADLEEFMVTRDGLLISNKDFNFWGVTFTPDSQHFFATLSTNGQHLLVKGDIAGRSAVVVHENVECPSLSPDASRIAYKKRFIVDGRITWQIHILDLATNHETPLGEKRSVDDQLEWLDNEHVLYSLPAAETGSSATTNVWQVAADGATAPTLFLKNAYSPAVAPSL